MTSVTLTFKTARKRLPAIDDTVVAKGVLEMIPLVASGNGQPLEVVWVIDRSGSMMGPRLQAVKAALEGLTKHLGRGTKTGVVAYDDSAYIVCPLVSAQVYPQYLSNIRSIHSGGMTAARFGLHEAVKMLEDDGDPNALKVIVLLTDGEETGNVFGADYDAAQIAWEQQAAEEVRGSGIHIIPVVIDESVKQRFVDTLLAAGPDPDAPLIPPQAATTAQEIELVLTELFKKVKSRVGTNLSVRLTPSPLTTVKSVYQVSPNLRAVDFHPDNEDWVLDIHDDLFATGMTLYIEADYEAEDDATGDQPFIDELTLSWEDVSTGDPQTADLGAVTLTFVDPGQHDTDDDPAMKTLIRTVLIQQRIDAGLQAAKIGDMQSSIAAFNQAASIAGASGGAHRDLQSLALQLGKQAANNSLSAHTAGASIARTSLAAQQALDQLNN